tara:strand:+ start:856 stop:1644 length:789 start_codon:yes stop_codon:yes gene_type:complete
MEKIMKKIMKKILMLSVVVLSLSNVIANEIFIYTNDDNVKGENVIGNEIVNVNLISGKTFDLKNNLSVVTSTNQTIIYALSSKTFIQQRENSSVYFNEFIQEFQNDFVNPENVIVKSSQPNFSVSKGQLFVLQRDENVDATIMTSLALINFKNAKFFLKTDPKYTAVYVYDGSVIVLETKGKKAKEVSKGNVLVVTPAPKFISPKIPPRRYHTMSTSDLKDLNIGEEQDIESLFKDLIYSFDNTIFVNYNTNIFGIKFSDRN